MKTKTKAAAPVAPEQQQQNVTIKAPNIKALGITIRGTAPYVQLRFSEKAQNTIKAKMLEGGAAKSKKNRAARDFKEDFIGAQHFAVEGWNGIPAAAFRSGLISACRLVGFKMTLAKLSLFIMADGFDAVDGTPLIRIKGKPQQCEHMVRNATGVVDLRVRAMWREWSTDLRVQYDADQFTQADVVNLLQRVGTQVGIGEGRPDSKNSVGMGWGTFTVES
jgi:hypothetical protein